MVKKYCLLVLPLLFLLSTCGYNNSTQTSGSGTIAFNVEWTGGPESLTAAAGIYKAPLNCAAAGISTVEVIVFFTNPQSQNNVVATGGPWDCNAHTGDISVPAPQNNVNVGIMGKNAAGGIVYYGEQSNISVSSFQTTDIGTVAASFMVPANVTALAGSGKNLITWNTVTSAVAYNVYWSTATGVTPANGTKVAIATSPSLSFPHTGITNGTTYYYIVTAIRGNAESAGSSEVNAKPIAGATIPVTGAATALTETTATLNGSFENPVGYTTSPSFEYGTTTAYGTATPSNPIAQTGPLSHTANLTGLTQNATYHYRLVTQNAGGTFNGADNTFTTNRTITTIAATQPTPRVLAMDSTDVFWTEHNNFPGSQGAVNSAFIKMVSKNSGTVTTLFTNGTTTITMPFGIAVDGTYVYWTDTAAGTVNKLLISGGTATIATTLASGLNNPQFIVVDSTSVYWTESGSGPGTGTVKKADIASFGTATLASGLNSPMGIAVDATPSTAATTVYWTESAGGVVKKTGIISGGTPVTLASGLSNPWSIAVDGTSVYWTENTGGWSGTSGFAQSFSGSIKKTGINGGTVTTLASLTSEGPQGIAVDANSVYWASNGGCRVEKVAINGGPVTAIATTSPDSCGLYIAVDATKVFWTTVTQPSTGIKRADK